MARHRKVTYRLVIPDEATPLEFLTATYRDERVPFDMRLDAAKAAAAYTHPRLIAVHAIAAQGEKIVLSGGLPRLPGTETIMPEVGREPVTIDVTPARPNFKLDD
jgi:hypothetical protein